MAATAPADLNDARRVRDLFDAVVDLGPAARDGRLDAEQQTDSALVEQVRRLLAGHDRADRVLRRIEGPTGVDPDSHGPIRVGDRVSHYRVLGQLGRGGMGVVYRAEDTRLHRPVALKFLPPDLTRDHEAREQLLREARAAGALDHPHLCAVHEVGEAETGEVFIAMACYEGETLRERIARGPLPVGEAVEVAAQTAEGLAAAHEAGLVHRDVKPANLLVTERAGVRLLDFGLAQGDEAGLTRPGVTPGTVAYMSPEQTRGEAVDARADLWALGVVLYEMLAGRRPFRGDRDAAVLAAIRHDEPELLGRLRPEVRADLAAVVDRLLQKDRTARYESAAEVAADLRAVQAGRPPAGRRGPPAARWAVRRRPLAWSVAAVALAALLVLLTQGGGDEPVDSVAVLPVANLSGDPGQDYFADGMTDLLINQLSQIGGFDRVIGRSSVMPYRGSEKTPQEIGRELGVDALVEGSALRDGDRVRINVNLIEARTGRSLWSRSFEHPLRDVLTLQRVVTQEIAREIEVRLSPQEAVRLGQEAPEVDPEAFSLYLRASRFRTRRHARVQIDYLARAVARDPSFAKAHAMLASETALQLNDYPRAEGAVGQALALDPDLPEAHVALGLIRQWEYYDWPGAEAALRRATELAPLDALAHHELAMLLLRVGRSEEALAEERRALYLDPTSVQYQTGLGEVHLYGRRYQEARGEFEKALRMDPDHSPVMWYLGNVHLFTGRHDEAARWYERTGDVSIAWGRRTEDQAALDATLARIERGELRAEGDLAGDIALIYTSLGEHERALHWLERAVDEHLGWVPLYLKVLPQLDPLRDEPRFQTLLRKVGLDDTDRT